MSIGCFIHGLLPRNKNIRKALRAFQKNEISSDELGRIYTNEAKVFADLQIKNNLVFINEGSLKWQDLLRPFCKYEGIEEGTLIRWFETNFFYRIPVVKNKITLKIPVINDFFCIEIIKNFKNSFVNIPDPITFALLCENNYYERSKDLIKDFSDSLLQDLEYLRKETDLRNLLISSPATCYFGFDEELIREFKVFVTNLRNSGFSNIVLHISFIKKPNFLKYFSNIDVDILSLDLCYGDRELIIKNIPECEKFGLGLIDTSTSLIEEPSYLIEEVKRIKPISSEVFLTNSSDLDLLPYEVALEKIKVFKNIAEYEL